MKNLTIEASACVDLYFLWHLGDFFCRWVLKILIPVITTLTWKPGSITCVLNANYPQILMFNSTQNIAYKVHM